MTSLLDRLLPTLCPETVSHFYVGMRPPPPASYAEAETACYSVPWLFLAMPLPLPVVGLDVPYYSADGGETSGDYSEVSIEEESERSSNRSTGSGEQEGPLGGSATGDEGGFVIGVGGRRHTEPAGAAETVAGGEVSVRFVCQVEAARLLATTAMGVFGDGGGGGGGSDGEKEKEGKEECARVLRASEAFFAAFKRSYCG